MPRARLRILPRTLALVAATTATVGAAPRAGADDPRLAPAEGPSLTVYSSADPAGFDPTRFVAQQRQGYNTFAAWQVPGYGVVKEERDVDLAAGTSEIAFTDVAEFIDPTTVSFADLTTPGSTMVLEQAFRFDLASPDKILERFVDEKVVHERTLEGGRVERIEGTVLSVNQGTVVLKAPDGLRFISSRDPGLRLPRCPRGCSRSRRSSGGSPTTVPRASAGSARRTRPPDSPGARTTRWC